MAGLIGTRSAPQQSNLSWQSVDNIDEQQSDQRHRPRVDIGVSVAIRNAAGQRCIAQVVNLSMNGLQIRCNTANAQILHPMGGKICEKNSPIVQTELSLPFADRLPTVSLCAQLVYLAMLAEEPRCLLGLKFLDPRPTAERLLEQFFIAQHRGQAEAVVQVSAAN